MFTVETFQILKMEKHGCRMMTNLLSFQLLMMDGYRSSEISKVFGKSKSTIFMYLKRFRGR